MECGVLTCCRTGTGQCGNEKNSSLPGYRDTCTNNGGVGGVISGELSAACAQAIPRLTALGVRCELWLGEDDSISSARHLFSHADETAAALLALVHAHPGIVGFNLDLEASEHVNASEIASFADFLTTVSGALGRAPRPGGEDLRLSADVACDAAEGAAVGRLGAACATLGKSGVHRLMNMRTYNAADFSGWARAALVPALEQIPLDVLGAGLGCWIDSRTKNTWNILPESAQERICLLMNRSVQEIDMFILKQEASPGASFPEPFWIPQLERFVAGGGCDITLPPAAVCPHASVGPNSSWVGGRDVGCCTSKSDRGVGAHCNASCAEAECAAAHMIWRPENTKTHPYECCHATRAAARGHHRG